MFRVIITAILRETLDKREFLVSLVSVDAARY